MRNRASQRVFIQSSLFGLISAGDLIPNYRLSAGSKLPGINLKRLWQISHELVWPKLAKELVIDLRSNAYAELAPIPESLDYYNVDVVLEDKKGKRTRLNHFNKQAKGQFVRATLLAKSEPKSVSDLKAIARAAGLGLEVSDNTLLLVTKSYS
jgi:cytoplasmic iron level regulating protein YaaA (DUF328/UPF0246 family)